MNWPTEFGTVAALFLLRVGLPLGITLLAGYLLSRLDAKWQADEAARRSLPAAPCCWEIMGCDPAKLAACPVRRLRPLPCWMARQRLEGRIPERCFDCEVFVTA
jgi:hypothetical protein